MMTKRLLWIMFGLIFCFGLIVYVPVVQATGLADFASSNSGLESSGDLRVRVQRTHLGNSPINLVVYDQDWKIVAGVELTGRAHTFEGLTAGDYFVAAEADQGELLMEQEALVFADQVTQVNLRHDQAAVSAAATSGKGSQGRPCGGVSGDGSMLKIYPSYGVTIIYMQCGHIVGKTMPSGCGCSAGNWRYTTDCEKSAPIYINLPCPGR
jgi:hypothetical protein